MPTKQRKLSKDKTADTSPVVYQKSKIKQELRVIHRNDLTDKQKEFIELALDKDTKVIFVAGPAGTSKAQPLDSKIITPKGWVNMGDLKVGDYVFSQDGKPTHISGVYPQGEKEVYRVSFSDGTYTECCKEHLWFTQTSEDRNHRRRVQGQRHNNLKYKAPKEGSVKSLEDIIDTLERPRRDGSPNHTIPLTKPVQFVEVNHLIDPYLMGILLGDGGLTVRVGFTSEDEEIVNAFKNNIQDDYKVNYLGGYDYSITKKERTNKSNIYLDELRRLGLFGKKSDKKFIPNEYMFDSVENREKLLQGLMDSDGMAHKLRNNRNGASTTISTCSDLLKDGIRELVESLGGTISYSTYETSYNNNDVKIECKDSHNIFVRVPNDITPFRLKRKLDIYVPKSRYIPVRYITNVEYVGKKECQCILVDNDSHLYLTNNYIVTHNTFLAVYCSLLLMNKKKISDIVYVRSTAESGSKELGFLPGEIGDKLKPYIMPLEDKLKEMLPKEDIAFLIGEQRIQGIPINYMRGASLNAKVIIGDEAQNFDTKELTTLITRLGEFSKMFILGDFMQSDIGNRSGFERFFDAFDSEESEDNGIHCFEFTKEDIVRSGILKYIIQVIEEENL